MTKFAQRLKEIREEKGFSQSSLAKAAGISQACISKWESGDRTPYIDYLYTLAKFFGCSSDYLIGLED
jgi:transcriptional regulator with XRE-family HTH domain